MKHGDAHITSNVNLRSLSYNGYQCLTSKFKDSVSKRKTIGNLFQSRNFPTQGNASRCPKRSHCYYIIPPNQTRGDIQFHLLELTMNCLCIAKTFFTCYLAYVQKQDKYRNHIYATACTIIVKDR